MGFLVVDMNNMTFLMISFPHLGLTRSVAKPDQETQPTLNWYWHSSAQACILSSSRAWQQVLLLFKKSTKEEQTYL